MQRLFLVISACVIITPMCYPSNQSNTFSLLINWLIKVITCLTFFPGYREELYSRLEIKRILEDHDKPKRPRLKQKSPYTKQVWKEILNYRILNAISFINIFKNYF